MRPWTWTWALVAVAWMGAGCTAMSGGDDGVTERSRPGKGDVPEAPLCESQEEPPTHDACEAFYGDGHTCDGFCQDPDPDCRIGVAQYQCEEIVASFTECLDRGRAAETCVPQPNDGFEYDAASACCRWGWEYCGALPDAAEHDPVIRWIGSPWGLSAIPAGDSGRHRVGTYEPDELDASAFLSSLKSFDDDVRGCDSDGRVYASSRQAGVDAYRAFVSAKRPYDHHDSFAIQRLETRVKDPTNRAVFASIAATGVDGDECDYADFYVFRPGGAAIHLAFDFRGEDDEATEAGAPGPEGIRYVDDEAMEIVERMHRYGGNGGSSIGTWSDAALDYDTLRTMVAVRDASVRDCFDRAYSVSSEQALERWTPFACSYFDMLNYDTLDGIQNAFPGIDDDLIAIDAFVGQSDNLAVVSGEFSDRPLDGVAGRDASTACLIWDFIVLRPDGTAVRLTVDFTD